MSSHSEDFLIAQLAARKKVLENLEHAEIIVETLDPTDLDVINKKQTIKQELESARAAVQRTEDQISKLQHRE